MNDSYALGQQRRIIWLSVVFAAVGVVLLGRLAFRQLIPRDVVIKKPEIILAARGDILDATGHYLAASTVTYDVSFSPRLLSAEEKKEVTPKLARILTRERQEISATLCLTGTENVILGVDLPAPVGEQIMDLDLPAFKVKVEYRRVYPDGAMAASILGFVNYEGKAHYGLEQHYDRELRGVSGEWYGLRDPWGKQILASLPGYRAAKDGAGLVLTLDRNIQHEAEQILRQGIEEHNASSGNIVVLDPRTGGVLAMANYPTYDPGDYGYVENDDYYINTSISSLYEPGSVFKPLTLAAALEAHLIRPTDTYDDRGEIIIGEQLILNSDRRAHGRTTMTELLAYSRNVGAAYVATLLGEARFYEMMRRFGFGEITGIGLAYEEDGIMRVPGQASWHTSDLATNSFGQGISTTPLQVVAAYAAIANDGVLMRPYVVNEVRYGERVEAKEPFYVRRVLSSRAAQQITSLMVDAVELGMKKAILPGYVLAGKSGTSEIPDQKGYTRERVIASFVGFGPLPDPRFVILVKFDEPGEGYWGADVAAQEFREMAEFMVDYYGLPPTQ